MATNLPYVLAPGRIPKLLQKIQEAKKPDKFSYDFLQTKLQLKGGSAQQLVPLLKRIGFLESSGEPTQLYIKFRNPDTQGWAMAQALKKGFSDLFERNEYAHELDAQKLKNLVVEITGKEHDDRVVGAITSTFTALKAFADFESNQSSEPIQYSEQAGGDENNSTEPLPYKSPIIPDLAQSTQHNTGLNVSYTINLNLPNTDDSRVFNAIFKSLKDNLLG